ncbi:MAG: hypothetical protein QGG40_05705, partial [Myxococcota bacterium]|nr:hypothetical protein [Myxococcota bacterium]
MFRDGYSIPRVFRRDILVTLALGLALSVAIHGPAIEALTGRIIPGGPTSDNLRALWSTWFVGQSLPGLPFVSDLSKYPSGVEFLPVPLLTLLAVSPITRMVDPAAGLATIGFAHTILAVAGGAFLARTMGARPGGALLAGGLLATLPPLSLSLREGVFEYQTIGWLPLQLAALV